MPHPHILPLLKHSTQMSIKVGCIFRARSVIQSSSLHWQRLCGIALAQRPTTSVSPLISVSLSSFHRPSVDHVIKTMQQPPQQQQRPRQPRKRPRKQAKSAADSGDDASKKPRNAQPGSAFAPNQSRPAQVTSGLNGMSHFGSTRNYSTQQVENPPESASIEPKPRAAPDVRPDAQPYASLNGKIDSSLLAALNVLGFNYMTPVQQMVLTKLPHFQSDCLVRAKTGTGKTVAFLLPVLHSLLNSPPLKHGHVGVLIISPTRELALQIAKECDQLTSQMSKPFECHTAFGGMC